MRGYDEWLDNYGDPDPGPSESQLIAWMEASDYYEETPDDGES